MSIAHTKVDGLDKTALLGIVERVLLLHGVEGVELLWRTDSEGRVLLLTIERPDSRVPGEGITIALCSQISRDVSAGLDETGLIPCSYRLEVGSPGLERALYLLSDYRRFAGLLAKVNVAKVLGEQPVLQGVLGGVDEAGQVLIDVDQQQHAILFANIVTGQLVFDWKKPGPPGGAGKKPGSRPSRRERTKSAS
jgi:ribosome maturation factor RimP